MATSQHAARPLLRLTYVSRASHPLGQVELTALRASCDRHNERLGLTGMLLYRGARFYAVLEGPERALLRRMEVIITDPRHCELRILNEQNVQKRRFVNWSLAPLPENFSGPTRGWGDEAFITMLAQGLP